jgi:hypothetical protein
MAVVDPDGSGITEPTVLGVEHPMSKRAQQGRGLVSRDSTTRQYIEDASVCLTPGVQLPAMAAPFALEGMLARGAHGGLPRLPSRSAATLS